MRVNMFGRKKILNVKREKMESDKRLVNGRDNQIKR